MFKISARRIQMFFFTDFSEGFDKVDYDLLLLKWPKFGIRFGHSNGSNHTFRKEHKEI